MENNYYTTYLKYKTKYLDLKEEMVEVGIKSLKSSKYLQ
jgi:hypothetical protein